MEQAGSQRNLFHSEGLWLVWHPTFLVHYADCAYLPKRMWVL